MWLQYHLIYYGWLTLPPMTFPIDFLSIGWWSTSILDRGWHPLQKWIGWCQSGLTSIYGKDAICGALLAICQISQRISHLGFGTLINQAAVRATYMSPLFTWHYFTSHYDLPGDRTFPHVQYVDRLSIGMVQIDILSILSSIVIQTSRSQL